MITDSYFDRFETPKYRNRNPIQRGLIRRFITTLHDFFIEAHPIHSVLEIGAGEGFISGYLSEKFPEKRFASVELDSADVERLKRHFPRIQAHQGSAYDLGFLSDPFDLVICAEVLEHLDEPRRALGEICKLRPRRTILTVPNEPWFMLSNLLRGKNVTRLGNDIDHVNHWSPRTFRALLEPDFEVLRIVTSYPWILALAAPK